MRGHLLRRARSRAPAAADDDHLRAAALHLVPLEHACRAAGGVAEGVDGAGAKAHVWQPLARRDERAHALEPQQPRPARSARHGLLDECEPRVECASRSARLLFAQAESLGEHEHAREHLRHGGRLEGEGALTPEARHVERAVYRALGGVARSARVLREHDGWPVLPQPLDVEDVRAGDAVAFGALQRRVDLLAPRAAVGAVGVPDLVLALQVAQRPAGQRHVHRPVRQRQAASVGLVKADVPGGS
mmetsp:Transcript_32310/g.107827  ORF Transcript_32310/g.107827 Transcript_32310/m.107827 type:complete len:246 (-) Transcript_32310:142-879(-)